MKICHVITRLIVGGAQENTVLTCRGLVERGHDVTLVAGPETGPEGSLWPEARETGCDIVTLDSLRRAVAPVRDRRAHRELVEVFHRVRPDVVHTHSSKAGILGRWAAASAGVPVVIHTIHGMSFNRTQHAPAYAVYRGLERWAARYTTAFVTVADAMIEQAVRAGVAGRGRFTTIRSGIETDAFRPDAAARRRTRGAWGVAEDEIVVVTVARLFEDKGYEAIIAAMPEIVGRVPRVRFVWIGDGARRDEYAAWLAALGLADRVHMAGLVAPLEVAALLNGGDIVLHASRWEGLPRAIVQGLLTGLPAVSFDNDGAGEVVVPDETGMLVPLGDIDGLAEAVVSLACDADRRRRLGRRGRARCLAMFDWRGMVDRLESLYDRCVASHAPAAAAL